MKNKSLIFILSFLLVLSIIFGGYFAYKYYSGKDKTNMNNNTIDKDTVNNLYSFLGNVEYGLYFSKGVKETDDEVVLLALYNYSKYKNISFNTSLVVSDEGKLNNIRVYDDAEISWKSVDVSSLDETLGKVSKIDLKNYIKQGLNVDINTLNKECISYLDTTKRVCDLKDFYVLGHIEGDGASYTLNRQMLRYEVVDDKLYIYDTAVIIKSYKGMACYLTSFDSTDNNNCYSKGENDNIINKYMGNTEYKHVFIKTRDNSYKYSESIKIK